MAPDRAGHDDTDNHHTDTETGADHAVVVLAVGRHDLPICRVADLGTPDLATVDALARLQLAARRRGATIAVRGQNRSRRDLQVLLSLTGLADLLGDPEPDDPDPPVLSPR